MDTEAPHHITSDLNNLAIHSEYIGGDDLLLGDGKVIPISHSGSTFFSTPIHKFTLKNVLCDRSSVSLNHK